MADEQVKAQDAQETDVGATSNVDSTSNVADTATTTQKQSTVVQKSTTPEKVGLTSQDVDAMIAKALKDEKAADYLKERFNSLLDTKRKANAEAASFRKELDAIKQERETDRANFNELRSAQDERNKALLKALGVKDEEDDKIDPEVELKKAMEKKAELEITVSDAEKAKDMAELEMLRSQVRSDFLFQAVERGYMVKPDQMWRLCEPLVDEFTPEESEDKEFKWDDVFTAFEQQNPELVSAFKGTVKVGAPSPDQNRGAGVPEANEFKRMADEARTTGRYDPYDLAALLDRQGQK